MVVAYIGIGANLGAAKTRVAAGIAALARSPGMAVIARSSCYRSAPMVATATARQPDYVNAVVAVETMLPPMRLLRRLQGIEAAQGRLRTGRRWTARTLDLDLLLFGDRSIRLPRLRVPHPGLAMRPFVLVPLAEIAPPDLSIPGLGPLHALLRRLPDHDLHCLGECMSHD